MSVAKFPSYATLISGFFLGKLKMLVLTSYLLAPSQVMFDSLVTYFLIMGSAAGALVIGYMVYNVIKYRERGESSNNFTLKPTEHRGSRGALLILSITMSVLAVALFASFQALSLYYHPPHTGPSMTIKVYAFQFGWNFTYPNGYSQVGTLIVPANTTIILNITSKDVMHSLGIPALDVKADAIPGFWNTLWFDVPTPSNFTIQCYELCGAGHAYMIAKLVVLPQAEFYQWYDSLKG
ncbi:cytochrome c oxidase subunit II [Candidatus Marsarchaeota G2 archaeon ECH_B_SAG-F08]|uniref:cytochrome-c oxidase n=4 Tax=Candidatus Marsarchaeota TaxID=1978152 RepID=A0A2R6AGR4_9ARCH|nr:MAG: cytochrome c oxidase subunit II [Candidatus Marsarchaeota G1 archaeon OSP_D]PSN85528.1 MAG: cytochrome c oxidase subunit II [Candidatus Marsarchaeota G1 archaeon BE_D]PSN87860.1 MAG: cytochrome c oxidase subunit II [Candidatus Marsarchaeota G1 archaeon OSP_C]PSN98233.1 MAG: cytochrome c oxidase subunit II [Candidatus Marsarchaeota G2 archaeon ECH_B_SAG-F08]